MSCAIQVITMTNHNTSIVCSVLCNRIGATTETLCQNNSQLWIVSSVKEVILKNRIFCSNLPTTGRRPKSPENFPGLFSVESMKQHSGWAWSLEFESCLLYSLAL